MFNILNIILIFAAAVLGFLLGPLSCKILNKIPAPWLCDYDEEPSQELLSGDRFKVKPTGFIIGLILAVAMVLTTLTVGTSVELPFAIVLIEIMMLISASDAKYTIIPDQFTAAVAVVSLIFAVVDLFTEQNFITKWYSPALGGLSGALILIILDLLSTLIFKRTGFGFGDVKLLAALGLYFGIPYIVVVLVLSFLVAAVHFLILVFTGKARRGVYMPMGPYICIAAVLTIALRPQFSAIFQMYKALLSMEALP